MELFYIHHNKIKVTVFSNKDVCVEAMDKRFKKVYKDKGVLVESQMRQIANETLVFYDNNIEKIWTAACEGNIEVLSKYYKDNTLQLKMSAFGTMHSIIMGAFRNRKYEAVKFLLEKGEKISPEETTEILNVFLEEKIKGA